MKILFIGGTGNISTDCAAWLHDQGHAISVVSRGQRSVPSAYQALVADRHDRGSLRDALKAAKPEVVLNFIGYDLPTVRLDHDILPGSVRQYLFISTAMVYAKPHRQLPLTEEAPLGNEFSDYAKQKLECEQWLLDRYRQDGFPATIVRPSHTYSPRWFPNVVASAGWTFAGRLKERKPVFVPDSGETPWALTATADFARGLGGLVGRETAIGECFHITTDESLTWNEIYAVTAQALDVDKPVIHQIPTRFIVDRFPRFRGGLTGDKCHPGLFDNRKIKRFVPGFECTISFADGIRRSVDWYRAHPEEQIVNRETDQLFDQVVNTWLTEGAQATT